MRNNQPVTQNEYPTPADATLVSYTDNQGNIVKTNERFVEVCGYTREELIGQPHNIIRHPDMPPEAFRDMWNTLKRGRPWRGLVKNRRKNGDHYWVHANASPTPDGGFMSVRTKPDVNDVRAAEALYAKMRSDDNLQLHEGQPVKKGLQIAARRRLEGITISQRLWAWAAFATLLFYTAMGLGWYGLKSARDSLNTVYANRMIPLEQLDIVRGKLNANRAEILLAMQHNPADPSSALHDHPTSRHLETVAANAAEIDKQWQAYTATYLTEDEKKLVAAFAAKRDAWLARLTATRTALAADNFSPQVATEFLAASQVEFPETIKALEAVIQYQTQIGKEEANAAETRYQRINSVFFILLISGATIGTLLAITLMRRIKTGLALASDAAKAIATGDLARSVPSSGEDEIGRMLDQMAIMRNNLHELLAELQSASSSLSTRSKELAAAAHGASSAAAQQSEATSSMAAAVEELSVSIDQVEAHSADARRVTQASAENSANSGSVIQDTAQEMSRIAEAVTRTAESVRGLESVSGNISSIVNVIREVADQTNLLALNAAIEAARAGEHGRGFAVVADEVRKLAERTASSTNEIATMIAQIQEGSRAAGASMDTSVARVNEGVQLASAAGESISLIRASTQEVTAAVDSIGFTLKEQATATREIASRVEHISHGTEELSASARQTAEAASEIEDIADSMESLAKRFRVA
ncbi:MAG: methyl-accepting chemotaxis protein [Rugosibacter sp.]|nr:methyl-accepting chemotaxis protein [Rugosibacter sp.]